MYRVLYVDDEPDLLNIGKIFLEGSGEITVTTAMSAAEGTQLLELEKFDTIVSDYQMPGMDGIQFLVEVRSRFGPIPFILFTGRGREEVVIQAINSGADFYLQKGGEPEAQFAELTHKIKSAIKQYSSKNALQMSETQFRAISENSQDYIMRYDKEHRHTYANPACLHTAGMTAEQFIGKTHHELGFPPDLCAIWEPAIDKVFATGQPYRETFAWTGVDGEAILDWRLFPEKDNKGNVVSVLGVSRDITAIKAVEKSLSEAQKRTGTVLDDIADTFYSLDDQWRFVIVNPAAEKAPFGRPASELLGRVIWDLYPGLVGTFIQQHYFNAAKNFSLEHYEGVSPLNGRWYEVFMQGWGGGVDVHMRDITERKQVVNTLQESHDRLVKSEENLQIHRTELEMQAKELQRTNLILEDSRDKYLDLYDFAPLGYFTLNDKAVISEANLTGTILLGVDRSKLVKARFSKFIAEKDVDEWHRYFMNLLHQKEKRTCTLMLKREGGSLFPTQLEGIRITGSDGAITVRVAISNITELKRAEEALRESEERYRAIYEQSPIAIELYNAVGELVHVNPACLKIFGVENMQVLQGFSLFADPNITDEQKEKVQWGETMRYQGPFDFEKVKALNLYPTSREGVIWLDVLISPLGNRADSITGFLVQVQDITGRKQLEKAQRESEEKFRLITETIDEVFWMADVEIGKIFYVSPSFERIWGLSRETLYENPRSFLDAVHKEDLERVLADLEIEKTGQPFDHEYRIILPDGNIRNIWDRGFPIRDEKGQISTYAGIAIDITERKRSEEALKQLSERLSLATRAGGVGIWDYDVVNNTLTWDDQMFALYGITKEKFSGAYDAWQAGLHPEDKQRGDDEILMALRGEKEFDTEFRLLWPDRTIHNIRALALVQRDASGKPLRMIGTNWEITEQKVLEKEMEYHEQELRNFSTSLAAANKKLTLLSSITRHDINNQLAVLMGYITILKKKQPDPTFDEYFLKVSNAAQRISAMIQFTREYEEIGVSTPIWQDVRTVLDTAVKHAPLGQVLMKNDLPAGIEVFADQLVEKVFYNLMDNAARYGGKITTIRFTAGETGDNYLIVCEDDGVGVPAEEKEKIFERGFGKNTGLGLALSREILDITGITIRETGESGKGARFEITVPKGAWRIT